MNFVLTDSVRSESLPGAGIVPGVVWRNAHPLPRLDSVGRVECGSEALGPCVNDGIRAAPLAETLKRHGAALLGLNDSDDLCTRS